MTPPAAGGRGPRVRAAAQATAAAATARPARVSEGAVIGRAGGGDIIVAVARGAQARPENGACRPGLRRRGVDIESTPWPPSLHACGVGSVAPRSARTSFCSSGTVTGDWCSSRSPGLPDRASRRLPPGAVLLVEFPAEVLGREPLAGKSVLEVGTGAASWLFSQPRRADRTVGVDINPEAVRALRINALLTTRQVQARQGDLFAPVAAKATTSSSSTRPTSRARPRNLWEYSWRDVNQVRARFVAQSPGFLKTADPCWSRTPTSPSIGWSRPSPRAVSGPAAPRADRHLGRDADGFRGHPSVERGADIEPLPEAGAEPRFDVADATLTGRVAGDVQAAPEGRHREGHQVRERTIQMLPTAG